MLVQILAKQQNSKETEGKKIHQIKLVHESPQTIYKPGEEHLSTIQSQQQSQYLNPNFGMSSM